MASKKDDLDDLDINSSDEDSVKAKNRMSRFLSENRKDVLSSDTDEEEEMLLKDPIALARARAHNQLSPQELAQCSQLSRRTDYDADPSQQLMSHLSQTQGVFSQGFASMPPVPVPAQATAHGNTLTQALRTAPLPFTPVLDQAVNLRNWQNHILRMSAGALPLPPGQLDMLQSYENQRALKEAAARKHPETGGRKQPPPVPNVQATEDVTAAPAPAAKKARSRKGKAKVTEEEKKKQSEDREKELIEVAGLIESWNRDYRNNIDCVEEEDIKRKNGSIHQVAKYFVVRRGTQDEKKYDMAIWSNSQLRAFCLKCSIKGGGNLNMYDCRKEIAMWKTMGTMYKATDIPCPQTTLQQQRLNTLMRLVNVCFNKKFVQKFIDLNDAKKRKHYEEAHGGSPIKHFFQEVSSFMNDPCNNAELMVLIPDAFGHIEAFEENGDFNLSDYNQQTEKFCHQHMRDLMKARETCMAKGMKASGSHDSDFWSFATNKTFTRVRKNEAPLPAKAVLYVNVRCTEYPAIDGKFSSMLQDSLKSDSDKAMEGTADAGEKKSSAAKREKAIMERFDNVRDEMKEEQQKTFQQRQQYIAIREEEMKAERRSKGWDEYRQLGREFLLMTEAENPVNDRYKENVAARLRELEAFLGIKKKKTMVIELSSDSSSEDDNNHNNNSSSSSK
ncbi:unknown protein [Seminavis robusta]|uniref:Uncharacterized protein n=1 Tax=Seminavis robusta TaxID=568900 RepID=A0A9N8DXF4_9STRA|nr:unknown protein [Seminavis robusta]|eukprot:Sro366_g127660.1 n/a (672) ;mRNA; f:62541-64556